MSAAQHITFRSILLDFKQITKAGLAFSVVFSSIAGYLLGVYGFGTANLTTLLMLAVGGYCMVGASNAYNQIIEKDLAGGKLDAAIVWGPIAGYYAKRVQSPKLTVVPLTSEPGVRFDYQMAMGVRYGEREWKQQVESLIESQQATINAILREYGVPLLENVATNTKP